MALQIRRGASADRVGIVPAVGELIYTIDTKEVYIGDGVTSGGNPVGKTITFAAGSGAYNNSTGVITIPTNTNHLTNGAGFITSSALNGYATETFVNSAVSNLVASAPTALNTLNELATALGNDANFATTITTALGSKANTSSLSTVATTGSYNDLANKPTIPSLTGTSMPWNSVDGGNIYIYADQSISIVSISQVSSSSSGTALDLYNALIAGTLAAGTTGSIVEMGAGTVGFVLTSGFTYDANAGGGGGGWVADATVTSGTATASTGVSAVFTSGGVSYNDLTNKPTLFSGSYVDLTNKPTLFSGSYTDLTNKPTIPTSTSQLSNNSGFITSSALSGYATETFVNSAVSNLVASAPAALNTLNELATALGNDANFATTITTALGNKQATLVSGTNIKTINGTAILGSGDITISGGGGGGTTTYSLKTGIGLSSTGSTDGDLLATLINPVTGAALFGDSISATEEYIVVGAYQASNYTGAVYVYSATTKALLYKLTNPNPTGGSSDYFGRSVAIYGNYIVVGAPNETHSDSTTTFAGRAYVYNISTFSAYTGTTITVSSPGYTLANPASGSAASQDYFGKTVAINNTYVVVATQDDTTGGKVYLFDKVAGTLLYTIDDPNTYGTVTYDSFGFSLSIKGNTLAVGAWQEESSTNDTNSGKAYVFNISSFPASPATITSSTWSSYGFAIENPASSKSSDNFGYSVALTDTYVAVGARLDAGDSGLSQRGTVYVFNKTTGTLVYTLVPTLDVSAYMNFGGSLSANTNHLLVGCPNGSIRNSYLFDLRTGKCVKTYTDPGYFENGATDYFGSSVVLTNNTAIIGASWENNSGYSSSGRVYVFSAVAEYNGSAEISLGLATTGVLTGTYGSTAGGYSAEIPVITVDKFGRVTSLSQTTFTPSITPPSAFYNIVVEGSPALTPSSSNDTLAFVGAGATTVTAGMVNGVKTITIESTASSGGGGGGPTVVDLPIANVYYYNMGPIYVELSFMSPSAVTTFLANVGNHDVTISGISGPGLSGSTITISAAEGSWSQSGSITVRLNYPLISPSIVSDYPYSATSASYTYTADVAGSASGYFTRAATMVSGSSASFTGPTAAGRLLIADPYVPNSGYVMNMYTPASSFDHITYMSTAGYPGPNGTAYPWLSMQSVTASSTIDVSFNNMVSGMISLPMYVLDASSNYNTQSIYITNGSGNIMGGMVSIDNYISNNAISWNNPGWIYGAIFPMGGDFSSVTAAPGVTTYWDSAGQTLWFRAPASAWSGGSQITLGTGGSSGSFSYQAIYFGS